MSAMPAIYVKGWCPGALRPMQSGDGLIVRLRPRLGSLPITTLAALAAAAKRFGNGHIDLTRRANLQIRGVSEATLAPLQQALLDLDLLDQTAAAEAVRNIMLSPLAGFDPLAVTDGRDVARKLEQRLAADQRLHYLDGKFGFIIDDGSAVSLSAERMDIALNACRDEGGRVVWQVCADGPTGPAVIGLATDDTAADAAVRLAHAFLDVSRTHSARRMRDVPAETRSGLAQSIPAMTDPSNEQYFRAVSSGQVRVGQINGPHRCTPLAVGLAVPFGRIRTIELEGLCRALANTGVDEVRLSPWRIVYVPVTDGPAQADAIREAAHAAGLGSDPGCDPIARIEACVGAPACPQALIETRELARSLTQLVARADTIESLHVSGCAKGCACPEPSDITVAGHPNGYALAWRDTARCASPIIVARDADLGAAITELLARRATAKVHHG